MATDHQDILVVGGGMAGLEAAAELRSLGVGTLVIDGTAPGAGRSGWRSATPPHYPAMATQHLRLGGRSLAWHGVVLRIEEWALADWPAVVADSLRSDWYPAIERDLEAWRGEPLGRGLDADDELASALGSLTGRSWAAVPRAVRPGPDGPRAYTPLDRWSQDGVAPTVAHGSAVEVVVERGAVAGARLADGSMVSASVVLVAAGALESTRLVAQARQRPDQAYPGLTDHLVEGLVARLPAGAIPAPGFVFRPAVGGDRCAVFVLTAAAGEEVLLDAWVMGEQDRAGPGAVRFPAATAAPWSASVEPALAARDEEVLSAGRAHLEELWAAVGGGGRLSWPSFMASPTPFAQASSEAAAAGLGHVVPYAWPLGTVDHEGGTLPYGLELDDDGRVVDVPGLWVAGPSTFPRAGAANPSLTTLALARRTASACADAAVR